MGGMGAERRTLLALSSEWFLEGKRGEGRGEGGGRGQKGLTYHSPPLLGAASPTLGL